MVAVSSSPGPATLVVALIPISPRRDGWSIRACSWSRCRNWRSGGDGGFLQRRRAVTVGADDEAAVVEGAQGGAVADADHCGRGEAFLDQGVEALLRVFIHGGGRLVEEEPVWLLDQRAGESNPLLLARRELHRPVLALVEAGDELGQAHRL